MEENIREVMISGEKSPLLESCFDLRRRVFVEEQRVAEEDEFDGFDRFSSHLLLVQSSKTSDIVIACCRLRIIPNHRLVKLERMAVEKTHRGLGLGTRLLRWAVLEVKKRNIGYVMVIHAQLKVIPFYQRAIDFFPMHITFMEDGIAHRTMFLLPEESEDTLIVSSLNDSQTSSHPGEYADLNILKKMSDPGEYGDPNIIKKMAHPGEHGDPNIFKKMTMILKHLRVNNTPIPQLIRLWRFCDIDTIGLSLALAFAQCAIDLTIDEEEEGEKSVDLTIDEKEEEQSVNLTINEEEEEEEEKQSDSSALESLLLNIAWEKLNTGHYSEVLQPWRRFYAICSVCRAVRRYRQKNLPEALRACDMGLMMGGDLSDGCLANFAQFIHDTMPPLSSIVFGDKTDETLIRASSIENPVSCEMTPSMERFCSVYLQKKQPVIVDGIVNHWPAYSKWSFDHFIRIAGYRTVPCEIGSKYTEESWSQELMPLHQFYSRFMNKSIGVIGYLAQHRLFMQIPLLVKDIIIPDYCALSGSDDRDVDLNIAKDVQEDELALEEEEYNPMTYRSLSYRNLKMLIKKINWFGPAGTVSPLHTDPRDNLLCQVIGRKFVRLISPNSAAAVYAIEDGILTNTSQVDAEHPDLDRFPLFAQAECHDCVLLPGQMLFIPRGWWHYVRSIDPSISVSCWFG